ncbi:hypothetical protein [Williamsia sp.]|uniref:hypothetical protein n=1 Tax=Williamsia sp. TaxID=1872085 RepID=UPI001A1A49B8|nr:hypothetical protein [Williamsia sp.]MBJ7291482.1 hypothetical protein [Williamsia sp.]
MTMLQELIPHSDFRECHSRWIAAPADDVWASLTALDSSQLRLTRALMRVRHPRSQDWSDSRNLFSDGPIRLLETDRPRYAVGGAVMAPWRPREPRPVIGSLDDFVSFDTPGWTKVLTDFRLREVDGGTELTTETRGYSTDAGSRRRFAAYWAVVRWGSGVIRRDMLATVARTALRPES